MLHRAYSTASSRFFRRLIPCSAIGLLTVWLCMPHAPAELPANITLRYVTTFPHDTQSYTQGLLWHNGYLYESAGQYGESSLRKTEPRTGNITARVDLPRHIFAEGLALVDDSLFQLTWRNNICFVYDLDTFRQKGQFQYPGEGWGLTYDGKHLIMSDGSNMLRFLDPKTFALQRRIDVFDRTERRPMPIRNLNELEWIRGEIWANVWQTTKIARINPRTGNVVGWIEMSPFVPEENRGDLHDRVLNGIAFNPETNHVYITGKYWKAMHQFLLEVPPVSHPSASQPQ